MVLVAAQHHIARILRAKPTSQAMPRIPPWQPISSPSMSSLFLPGGINACLAYFMLHTGLPLKVQGCYGAPLAFPSLQNAHRDSNSSILYFHPPRSFCSRPAELLRASVLPFTVYLLTPALRCFVSGHFYILIRLLLRSSPRLGRLLSSLLFFPVSRLRRTPAQRPCYESKGRLFPSLRVPDTHSTVGRRHRGRPKAPARSAQFLLNSQGSAAATARHLKPRSDLIPEIKIAPLNALGPDAAQYRQPCSEYGPSFFPSSFLFFLSFFHRLLIPPSLWLMSDAVPGGPCTVHAASTTQRCTVQYLSSTQYDGDC